MLYGICARVGRVMVTELVPLDTVVTQLEIHTQLPK